MNSGGLNLYFPLIYSKQDGPYKTTKTLKDAIIQNLKVLFLTNPGERIMDRLFGVGIKRFLFENINADTLMNLQEAVYTQIGKYMPFLTILKFDSNFIAPTLYVKMTFMIEGINQPNLFELTVEENT